MSVQDVKAIKTGPAAAETHEILAAHTREEGGGGRFRYFDASRVFV
jgi:hypothetical protein